MPHSERVHFLKGLPGPRKLERRLVLFDSSQHLQAMDGTSKDSVELIELLGAFPPTVCARRFKSLVDRSRATIELRATYGTVIYLVHLYMACVNFQLMVHNWADTNLVISAHPDFFKFLPSSIPTLMSRLAAAGLFKKALRNMDSVRRSSPRHSLTLF